MKRSRLLCIVAMLMAFSMAWAEDYIWTFNPEEGLITDASQLYANSVESEQFNVERLIDPSDDYTNIIFHSSWSDPLPKGVFNYLQVHLNEAREDFIFTMIGSNWVATYDTPDEMEILVSNEPENELSWISVAELPDMIPEDMHNVHPAFYTSPRINLGAQYTDIRFVVKATVNNRDNYNGNIFFSLARFQMYAPIKIDDPVELLQMTLDDLRDYEFPTGTDPGFHEKSLVDAYESALSEAQKAVASGDAERCRTAKQALTAAFEAVMNGVNPVTDGFYYIVNSDERFIYSQNEEKAMFVDDTHTLSWKKFDESDESFIFRIESKNGDYSIRNFNTGEYITYQEDNATSVSTSATPGVAQLLTSKGAGKWHISNLNNNKAYHAAGHNSGAGEKGFVSQWQNGALDFCLWYLRRIDDEAYIKELTERQEQRALCGILASLAQSGREVYNSAFSYIVETDNPLITDASQLYANSVQSEQFNESRLIDPSDDYNSIIFHSSWDDPLPGGVYNYLQVHFNEAREDMIFTMIGSGWPGTYDTPDQMEILVTNDPNDDASWVSVANLPDMIPSEDHNKYPARYTSPRITFGGDYTDVRFVVKGTTNNRSNGNGNVYFSLARFQIYGSHVDYENSLCYRVEGLEDACEKLFELIEDAQLKVDNEEVTQADIDELTAAIALARELIEGKPLIKFNYTKDLATGNYWYYNPADGLLTTEDQLYANSEQSSLFRVGRLIDPTDNYSGIIFHTSWDNPLPADVDNYLQFHFNEPHDAFVFTMVGSGWAGTYDTPDHVVFLGTNTPEDDSSWKTLVELPDLIPDEQHEAYPAKYQSPRIALDGSYTDLRMLIKATTNNRNNGKGNIFVSLARMQFYESRELTDQAVIDSLRKAEVDAVVAPILDSVAVFYNKVMGVGTTPLILRDDQLYANSEQSEQFYVGRLIDPSQDYSSIIFHTSWDNPLPSGTTNYIQVHLDQAVEHFTFSMIGSNWPATYDTPDHIIIQATNTPDKDDSWVNIIEMPDLIPAEQHGVHPAQYTSPVIELGAAYTDFRFMILETVNMRLGAYGVPYVSLARFQMWGDKPVDEAPYSTVKGLAAAVDAMMAAADAVKANPTDENIARLREAIKLVRWTLINGNIEPGNEPINILFIGNSITYGAGLGDRATQTPPVKCAEKVAEDTGRSVFFQNCGVSGATTLDWLPKTSLFRNASRSANDLTENGGYLFFSMMLGTNDSAESGPNGSPVSPEDYGENLKTIIGKLHSTFPDALFIVNYPIWYSPNTHNGAVYLEGGLNRLKSYHPVIDKVVTELQGQGLQIWTGSKEAFGFFEDKPEYFIAENGYDGIFYLHPNATGAEHLGHFWAQSIIEHLPSGEGIDGVTVGAPADAAVYTLQGQRIYDTQHLAPGLYIVGGRKVVVIR
ncbi:MAG: hypothetical protein IK011_03675 [Bacteroidaceae bacterium]|nr:hypothetical protein [Bacteroidaceae bacterium]